MFTVYEICANIEFIEFDLEKSMSRLTPYLGTEKYTPNLENQDKSWHLFRLVCQFSYL